MRSLPILPETENRGRNSTQNVPHRWRLLRQFTVRTSSLSTSILESLEDRELFTHVERFLEVYEKYVKVAKGVLGQPSDDVSMVTKTARSTWSPVSLAGERAFATSLAKLLRPSRDSDSSELHGLLKDLLLIDDQGEKSAKDSYSQIQDSIAKIISGEDFQRSVHPHPFRIRSRSTLDDDFHKAVTSSGAELSHLLSLLKLILRMVGRNDSTRALGKIISGRVNELTSEPQSFAGAGRYYILLDRNLVQRFLLQLKYTGVNLGLECDTVPHSSEFFALVSKELTRRSSGDRFLSSMASDFSEIHDLCLQYETSYEQRVKRQIFDRMLAKLLDIDERLGRQVRFPYEYLRNLPRILDRLRSRAHMRFEGNDGTTSANNAFRTLELLGSNLVYTHLGSKTMGEPLSELGLAELLFGITWLSGEVTINRKVAETIESSLSLILNTIESFAELASQKFAELAARKIDFGEAVESAIEYGLGNASARGSDVPQAVYNVSDVMLVGTLEDMQAGHYEIVIGDLNVRGWFLQPPNELYRATGERSLSSMLAEHVATTFRNRDQILWAYGGLRPSGIAQLIMHSLSEHLARSGKALHARCVYSFSETLRVLLGMFLYPRFFRKANFRSGNAEGLWYMLDEEYRIPSNALVGHNRDFSVRFFDSYFFLRALAEKERILETLLSKLRPDLNGLHVRVRMQHNIPIEELSRCFTPLRKSLRPALIWKTLVLLWDFKTRHGLGPHIYVRGLGKPVLISLRSMPCVLLLRNLVTQWRKAGIKTVKISNMYPAVDELWLNHPDGPHTSELRVVMIRQT